MSSKTLATKVSEESELYRRFGNHAEDYSSKSEALRVAIRRGIEDDDDPAAAEKAAWGMLSLAVAGMAFGVGELAGVAAIGAAVVFIGVAVYRWQVDR